ncbi:terminase [Amycolatopsis thermoflava]|uniref:terminase n=1 Tax=Amycolatopsis thermoflava TaxID=84480 RepID=UPI003666C5B2
MANSRRSGTAARAERPADKTRPPAGRPSPANTRKRLTGCAEPRLWTPPLRPLTRKTTRGYEVIDFARDVLGEPLLPWQEFAVIHGLELLPDGTFRFRTVVTLVSRQNGKTHLSKVLALWRLFVDGARLVLGAAQDLGIAREVLDLVNETVDDVPELAEEKVSFITANGKESLNLDGRRRYLIKASNNRAGRGLTVDHLTLDELCLQHDWAAWSSLSKTITARANGQIWALSNAGDDRSVVLNHLRSAAGVVTGDDGVSVMGAARDESIGIFEWSAVEGCALDDRQAWAQANPSLGHTLSERSLASSLATDPPNVFRTEVLCQNVDQLDGAVDLAAWKACEDGGMTLDDVPDRVLTVDVAPDGEHVTATVVGERAGLVLIEVVGAWDSTEDARAALPELREQIKPKAGAWFPGGPAAALAPLFRAWPEFVEIKGATVAEACQGFADLVRARKVLHAGDPLLTAHVAAAAKLHTGDGWRFVRNGAGHVDAAYSAAGGVHTVLTLPEEQPAPWFGVI